MPATRFETVAELVEAALDLEPAQRLNFLDRECADDAVLRAEVESLLKFQPQARHFIEMPAYEIAADTLAEETGELQPGDSLGEYTIESLLGEGGMGEVYLARDVELGRAVAIKLIKRAFARANFLRQFRREERILAGLTHPNIARLYGGGLTHDGLPFFVMEYIEGERLDAYCSSHQPPIRDRLAMFQKICAAVSYAHQHLVIHRDLKPANIRVTPEGEPKLLDFGIAKLIDAADAAPAGETINLGGVMTPEYASPEQVRGEAMTTSSDVYSLGVILYEMLTGEKPFRLTSRRPAEISRTITQQTPTRPSLVANQHSEIRNQRSLRGDLDNIVLMAMRKEPERRYASVALLASDIARHLDGRPVSARRDTWSYRSGKFIRRHRVGVATALLVLLSLLGGIFATAWQARRAEEQRALAQLRFDEVRRLAHSLIFDIHDSVADLPGSTPTRQLIVSRALEYLDRLDDQAGNDPSLARELAAAYIKIGNVQGNPSNPNLGDTAGALASFRGAEVLLEPLLSAHSDDTQARRLLAVAQEKMCDVLAARGEIAAAVANARRSLGTFTQIAQANPNDVAAQRSVVISHIKNGDVLGNPNLSNNGDTKGALAEYQTALRILQTLPETETPRLTGIVEERIGTISAELGDIAAARQHYETSRAIRLRLAEEDPNNFDVVRDAAIADEKIADVLVTSGTLDEALAARQRSLAILQRLADADPRNVHSQQSLAVSYMHLADLLGGEDGRNLGRRDEAIMNYRRAADILENHTDNSDAKNRELLEAVRAQLRKLGAA